MRAWSREGDRLTTSSLRGLDLADWLMLSHDDDRRSVDLEVLLCNRPDPLGHDDADWLAWRVRYDLAFEGYRVRLVPRPPRSQLRYRQALCWRLSIWTP